MAKARASVPPSLRWRIEDIFASQQEWEALYENVATRLDFSSYEGRLADPEVLLTCLEELNAVVRDLSRLGVYAFMKRDEDTRDPAAVALNSRVETLEVTLSGNTAFLTPELTALPEQTLKDFIADKRFSDYDYTLRGLLREKPHVLSRETEQVLALSGKVMGGFHDIFGMLDNADFPAPTVRAGGKPVTVTHGTYGLLLRSPDRALRKKTFQLYYKAYAGLLNTITATYTGSVEKDVFLSRARRYESCLSRALAAEDVDPIVYENLLACVEEGLPLLHRYFADRKRLLGYRQLHMYDVYTPLVENAELQLEYEDAFRLVKEGLAPLGERYAALLDEAHDGGWIDVEETEGKRSGAYSVSVYGLPHPYVLLNYQKTTSDVFTIAHELGHAMHSYHSERAQPQEKADYKIFVAEVASTVNEVLLLRHLLRTTTDAPLRKYLLSYYMDTLKGTLFRQTQFAEFEYLSHKMAEEGKPLTRESLSDCYLALNKKYYGPAVESDPEIAYEWARRPHIYRAFYVYKYATGIIAAVSIVDRIEREGETAVADYFKFLSSGGSDSPVELLKLAGVDLTKRDAFTAAMRSFEEALAEFESLS